MSLTVTTAARSVTLTTVARVKTELDISVSTHDTILDTFVRQASDMAEKFCQRIFARQAYTEVSPSFGGPYQTLRQAPVVALSSSSFDGEAMTDVSISESREGLLYRQDGFDWSAQRYTGILASGRWLDQGMPIPLSEERLWSFSYTAGFIVPAQNLLSVATVSADATDDSFNDSASGFPALLKAGDIIETSGFSNSANNGRFIVTGTPTTAKILAEAALTTEGASAGRTVLVSNLPGDVERGCIEIVKSLYSLRSTAGSIVEKQAGPMRVRYSEQAGPGEIGLPPSAIGSLRPWVRRVA